MDHAEATRALTLLRTVVARARDDTALENWGRVWILHGIANAAGFIATNQLLKDAPPPKATIAAVWVGVVAFNVVVAAAFRKRRRAVQTFAAREIRSLWLTFLGSVALVMVLLEIGGDGPRLLPAMIAALAAVRCASMGGLLGRAWYVGSVLFAASAIAMAGAPGSAFLMLGVVWGSAQIGAGVWLERRRRQHAAAAAEAA